MTEQNPTDLTREARTAARWWADQIAQPQASLGEQAGAQPTDEIASPAATGPFARLAEVEAEGITPEKVEAFRDALVPLFASGRFGGMGIGTDYGPDPEIAAALEAAGIRAGMTVLPLKTVMWVKPGSVRVSKGYGAPAEEVPLLDDPSPSVGPGGPR